MNQRYQDIVATVGLMAAAGVVVFALVQGTREHTGKAKRARGRKVIKKRDGHTFREYPKAFPTKSAANTFAEEQRKKGKRARVESGRLGKQTVHFVLIG